MPIDHRTTSLTLAKVALSFAMALTLSLNAHAQLASGDDEDLAEERWYQVEVILFAHTRSADDEIWRSDIALAYPPNWVKLKDPLALIEQANQQADTQGPALHATDNSNQADSNHVTAEAVALPEPVDLQREPYYLLPDNLRALNSQAQELKWSRAHRVLFHQAWRQPIVAQDRAPSLLIAAGEPFGDHVELEGTFSISVSRYLHLSTNLWFTQFDHNYGQDQGEWPQLPTPPDLREYKLSQWEQNTNQSPWEQVRPLKDEYDKILATPYIPSQITLLKQKRRMRSKEIHYIDHPKVGMIILVEPFEIQDPVTEEPVKASP